MSKKVLIFSESFGLGHERAASALIRSMQIIEPNVQVMHTNSIKRTFPKLTKAFLNIYLQVITNLPHLWHRIYENGRKSSINDSSKKAVYRLLVGSIKRTIEEFRPDIIVCTHPFPAAVICKLKHQGLNIPLVGIITDYDVHGYWLDSFVDMYIIGDKKLEADFDRYKFEPKLISSSGIPIDPLFTERKTKEQARELMGIQAEHPVVTVAGGGWGLGDLGKIAQKIVDIPEKPQVIIITGTNYQLQRSLCRTFKREPNIIVKGLISNIHEYMQASDVMVTKPGGLTTSEALATGLPMVLFDVIYGQEVWNARFLTEQNAAVKCNSFDDIFVVVRDILLTPETGKRLSVNAKAAGKPDSGIAAAKSILELAV